MSLRPATSPPGSRHDDGLDALLQQLAVVPPEQRIELRAAVLAYGDAAILPLVRLVASHPRLGATVAAWLEALAAAQPETKAEVKRQLAQLAQHPDGDIARAALTRMGAPIKPGTAPRSPAHRGKSAACEAVHARLIDFARAGRTVPYSDLETSRGHIGHYLHTISLEEAAAGRPPLTSIVVGKGSGRPGDGYIPAMVEVGFAEPHEELEPVWQRAIAAVFSYWRDGQGTKTP